MLTEIQTCYISWNVCAPVNLGRSEYPCEPPLLFWHGICIIALGVLDAEDEPLAAGVPRLAAGADQPEPADRYIQPAALHGWAYTAVAGCLDESGFYEHPFDTRDHAF